jgi:uncharacterized membrane protein YhaH (DUF805 family)
MSAHTSINDEILADRQKTWNGVGRLLFWGTVHSLVLTLIVVLFLLNGPKASIAVLSVIIFLVACAITAFALTTRK